MDMVDGEIAARCGKDNSGKTYQHECDACKYDDKINKAICYCDNCEQYLCGNCKMYHKKFGATRKHVIREGDDIPTARKLSRIAKSAIQHCEHHVDEMVEFYCDEHKTVLCKICRSIQHRKCGDVKRIDQVSAGAKSGPEINTAIKTMINLISKLDLLKKSRTDDLQHTMDEKAKCCEEIATTRSEVNDLFNELERDLYKDLDRREASDTAAISENLHVIAHTITHLTATLKGAQDAVDVNDDAVFIAINKSDQLIREGETIVADIEQDASTSTFTFKPDDAVSELTKLKQLGEIVADTIKVFESQQVSGKSLKGIEVTSFAEHNVKTKGQNVTRMTSATAVGDDWSVICYADNCKLKLLDSNQKCIDTITLRSPPYDVAADGDSVIVTLPEENKLQYVDVGQKLSIARARLMGKKCYGVSVSKCDIVVSCVRESSRTLELLVLNKFGKSVKQIPVPVDISPSPVWWPAYVAVNEKGNKIYVSNPVTSTIYSLTYEGELVNTYRDVDPIRPWMITVEGEDTLMCVAGRITVHKAAKLTKK